MAKENGQRVAEDLNLHQKLDRAIELLTKILESTQKMRESIEKRLERLG